MENEEHAELKAETVVDASRDESAVLHLAFEWDDVSAAEIYQAMQKFYRGNYGKSI